MIVSTRSMAADGIVLTSTISAAFTGCARRPSMSTSVRFVPMPRRLTLAMPGVTASGCTWPPERTACLSGDELRHLVQHALDAERARVLEPVRVDRHDRARRVEVAAHDARAGDGDFFEPGSCAAAGAIKKFEPKTPEIVVASALRRGVES